MTDPTPARIVETVHFMADIETLGTKGMPVITSLCVVAFSKRSGIIGTFYGGVDIGSCRRIGATIDTDTLMWWLDPKRDEARHEWFNLPKLEIDDTLDALIGWMQQWAGRPLAEVDPTGNFEIGSLWGKGSTFDCVILDRYADALNLAWPFSFRQYECYRTMANRFPGVPKPDLVLAHSALDDARGQAEHLLHIAAATPGFSL